LIITLELAGDHPEIVCGTVERTAPTTLLNFTIISQGSAPVLEVDQCLQPNRRDHPGVQVHLGAFRSPSP
jgi:hypothetical protein